MEVEGKLRPSSEPGPRLHHEVWEGGMGLGEPPVQHWVTLWFMNPDTWQKHASGQGFHSRYEF